MKIESSKPFEFNIETVQSAMKGDFGFVVTGVEKIEKGFDSQVFKATVDDKTIFVRINKKLRTFPAEIVGYRIFKEKDIPVPDVIAYQECPPTIGYPTMVIDRADGIELAKASLSPEQEDSVYQDMGKLLRTINETKIEGYGPAEAVGQELKGNVSSWRKAWERSSEDLRYLKSSALLSEHELEKLSQTYEEIKALDFGKSSLLHRDISGAHVFVTKDKITGIIDLGRLFAGDPRYDIAMSLVYQNDKQQESFKKGYGALAYDKVVDKYLLLVSAAKIIFRSKNGFKNETEKAISVFRKTLAKIE